MMIVRPLKSNFKWLFLFGTLITLFSILISPPVSAVERVSATHTGSITLVHYNQYKGKRRGACIKMTPAIPTKNRWACVDMGMPLGKEVDALIREAFLHKLSCRIRVSSMLAGDMQGIDWIDCRHP